MSPIKSDVQSEKFDIFEPLELSHWQVYQQKHASSADSPHNTFLIGTEY